MKAWRKAIFAGVTVASLSGCLAPSWLGLERPYDKNKFVSGYCMCYDAGVVVQGYPLPLCLALGLERGHVGWDIVMTTALPVASALMLIGGTLAAPVLLFVRPDDSFWNEPPPPAREPEPLR
jgi:hypothetical protein